MKLQRLGVVLLGFFIVVGCADKEVPIEEQATIDVAQVKADKLLAKDIRWMEEQNTQLHTVNDSQIVTYDTLEPIGPYVQYEADDMYFDSDRHPFYVAFHGKQYRFELGWTGPNLHTLAYTELADTVRTRKEGLLSEAFQPFISEMGPALTPSTWQMTAADVDGDGMLDLMITASYANEQQLAQQKILAVYRFTDDEQEPFELATHVQTSTKIHLGDTATQFLYTKGQEFVAEEWNGESVVTYFEQGDWYVTSTQDLPVQANLSTAYLPTAQESNFSRQRSPAPYLATCYTPWVTSEQSGHVPNKVKLSTNQVVEELPNQPMTAEDSKRRAGEAAVFYVQKSIDARKHGDYSIAKPYIVKGSPIEADMQSLVPSDANQRVTLVFEEFTILDVVNQGNGYYDVHMRNVYDIQGTKRTGFRTFESQMRLYYDATTDQFYAYELLNEVEL
ncbi:hypothetical protein BN1050_01071 [Metalysinibacillus saudimassiliensis]|uniref:TcaA protein NTF2-like domain-containing protein n=1 Tax=Metalysinibacillus saudimassiliensis TaxID=1461583 RepID=A0A078M309_9BACL|nr:hypothetical protein BN1050_01071 [Metalysinibacillus saudimassiliensis]